MSTNPKPKVPVATGRPDDFQTPPYALGPLLPYLTAGSHIWEPSAGKGNLVRELCRLGFGVTHGDILTGQDFFTATPPPNCAAIVTNPPFSVKNEYIARCYALGLPFALLMPLTALETPTRQAEWSRGLELIVLDKRVNFETPSGQGTGSWFGVAWYTWGLNIGRVLTFASLEKPAAPKKPCAPKKRTGQGLLELGV